MGSSRRRRAKFCVARPAAHKKGHAIALLPCEIDNFSEVQRRAAHPKFAGVCGQCRTQNFRPATKKKTMGKSKCNGGHSIFGEQNLWDQPPTADRGVAASLPSEMYRDGPHTKIRTWPHTAAPGWCPLLAGNGSGAGPCSRLAILPTGLPEFGAAVAEWRARPRAARLFFSRNNLFSIFSPAAGSSPLGSAF